MLNEFLVKGGKKLRLGYTTGSCAAAAAKAAAFMLLTRQEIRLVRLLTPKGIELDLEIEDARLDAEKGEAVCAVRKDSGDDPDVTNGVLIYARAAFSEEPGIRICGGEGVGRVTRPGLDQPVGEPAINSAPRKMIMDSVREVLRETGNIKEADETPGIEITISVPRGEELAAKTFNPKLGIVGGISILGTSGIVEPMSDKALLDTIEAEIRVRRCEGSTILAAAPGNYGKQFFLDQYGFPLETAVTASNFIFDTVKRAEKAGFTRLLFVGHIGKLVKVAGGIRNTHSQYGDHRMEILEQITEDVCGAVSDELKNELDECISTDEAVRILQQHGAAIPVLAEMTRRIKAVMEAWTDGRVQTEVIVFSNIHGELGKTPQAEQFLRELREERRN